MKEKNIIEDLKEFISDELGECDYKLWPKVCELQSTQLGKQKLIDMVIRYVAEEGTEIGSAIAFIEQELAHNEEGA